MLCFKETLTLGIDLFYEPNNSKWVMAKRSSGNLVLPFRDSSIFVKNSVTISRSVDWLIIYFRAKLELKSMDIYLEK